MKTYGFLAALALATAGSSAALAQDSACSIPAAEVNHIQNELYTVVQYQDHNGGLFNFLNQMWSAVVDRTGRLCSVIKVNDAWPGSRAIAIAKAGTANDFSNQLFALSTANLFAATQPGGSLYGLNNSNPFNPVFNQQEPASAACRAASSRSAAECPCIRTAG